LGLHETCVDVPRKRRERKTETFEGVNSFVLEDFNTQCDEFEYKQPEERVQANIPVSPTNSDIIVYSPDDYSSSPGSDPFISNQHQISPTWSDSPSPPLNDGIVDLEKQNLFNEIVKLQHEKFTIKSLFQNPVPHDRLSTDYGFSRWRVSEDGYCHLLAYSSKFQSQCGRYPEQLNQSFTCYFLYPNRHHKETQMVIDLIGCGRVSNLSLAQVFDRGNHELFFHSHIAVEFDGEHPVSITMISRDIDPEVAQILPLFQPLSVQLRLPEIPKPRHTTNGSNSAPPVRANLPNNGFCSVAPPSFSQESFSRESNTCYVPKQTLVHENHSMRGVEHYDHNGILTISCPSFIPV